LHLSPTDKKITRLTGVSSGCYIPRLFPRPGSVHVLAWHAVSWDASGCPGSTGFHGLHLALRHLLHATTTSGSSCLFPVPLVLGSAPLSLAQPRGLSRTFLTWVMRWVRDAKPCAWDQAAHPGPHWAEAQTYQIQPVTLIYKSWIRPLDPVSSASSQLLPSLMRPS